MVLPSNTGIMNLHHVPNIITGLRVLLVVPLVWSLLAAHYQWAFYLFLIAGCSDGLDGFLARYYGWTSRLGAMLDPLADKILLMSSFVVLAWLEQLPFWLVMIILARDLWIMSGATAYHLLIGEPRFAPQWISKLNTVLQIVLIIFILLNLGFWKIPEMIMNSMIFLVLLTTLMSFVEYTWVWSRRAWLSKRKAHEE